MTDNEALVELVRRIWHEDFESEVESEAALAEFEAAFLDPYVSEYIYYWEKHFGEEPSLEQIIEKAQQYRPLELGTATVEAPRGEQE